jgi:TP901 family phage tail tape measure protein
MVQRTWTGRVILKGEKRGVNKAFSAAENSIGNIANRLKGMAGFAAFAAAGVAIAGTAGKIKEFEKSISDLSAITGATGKDLDKLTEASKRIGATTTLSASQAAEAFKLMASAKPDLLDNLDALTATTEASVTLAEAAGLELPQATAALGEALNQFGAGADQATKFIDVLAAGARLGSSEIAQTSEALRNAGTVSKLAGLSFAETNAAIQGLAASGIKGSDAGTKLRSVLIKLQTQANDEFNPAVVGINEALKNLEDANLSVTEKTEIFGERSVATADILIAQRKTVADLSIELEDSLGAAQDQAATRTDNLAGDIKRLMSVFEAIQINLGNKMLPTLRAVIQSFTDMLSVVESLTASDGINQASEDFASFDLILKGLFVTGNVVKNLFDIILETFKGVGRIIGAVMSGSLDNVKDAIDQMSIQTTAQVHDMAAFAFATFEPEAAQAIRDAEASVIPATEALLEEIIVTAKKRTTTAGQEAAALAAQQAAAEAEKVRAKEAARIEGLRESFRTERQVVSEEWILKLEQLAELEAAGAEIGQTFAEARVELALETARRIAAIEAKGLTTRQKFEMKSTKDKGKFLLQEGSKLTAGVAQQSKTMFKINKTLALANAVATLPSAVIKAIDNGGGLPWGAIPGAITLAAGLAQIQAIKSTTFSGGGGGTTPSLAGSTGSINNVPVGNTGSADGGPLGLPGTGGPDTGGGQKITINIDGLPSAGPVPAEMVRELIGGINEQLGDGVELDTGAGQ